MSTESIKDIGSGVKDGAISIFFKLMGGSWSLVAVIMAIMWVWLHLTPEQVERLLEIEKLFNSWVGILLMIAIMLSYVASLIGKLKDDIREIFTNPVKEMTYIMAAMREDVKGSEESLKEAMSHIERKFEKSIDKSDVERGEMIAILKAWKPILEGK